LQERNKILGIPSGPGHGLELRELRASNISLTVISILGF
jgi:hypothetical protein